MNADDLKRVLQVLKEFDIGAVKLEMGELKLECSFNSSKQMVASNKKPLYATSVDGTTADELMELGFAGVLAPPGVPDDLKTMLKPKSKPGRKPKVVKLEQPAPAVIVDKVL